ncbi:MAG: hypothetical protein RIB32_00370 [Phycisphaerales bacterium]
MQVDSRRGFWRIRGAAAMVAVCGSAEPSAAFRVASDGGTLRARGAGG